MSHRRARSSNFAGGQSLDPAELWSVEAELAVPAALEGAIDADQATVLAASVVVEAANGPTTPEADEILGKRGVTIVPDILANAGGVTASYFEWAQSRSGFPWEEEVIATRLATFMDDAFAAVWKKSVALGVSMRRAAGALAVERVAEAFAARGLFPDPAALFAALGVRRSVDGAVSERPAARTPTAAAIASGAATIPSAAAWRTDGSAPACRAARSHKKADKRSGHEEVRSDVEPDEKRVRMGRHPRGEQRGRRQVVERDARQRRDSRRGEPSEMRQQLCRQVPCAPEGAETDSRSRAVRRASARRVSVSPTPGRSGVARWRPPKQPRRFASTGRAALRSATTVAVAAITTAPAEPRLVQKYGRRGSGGIVQF